MRTETRDDRNQEYLNSATAGASAIFFLYAFISTIILPLIFYFLSEIFIVLFSVFIALNLISGILILMKKKFGYAFGAVLSALTIITILIVNVILLELNVAFYTLPVVLFSLYTFFGSMKNFRLISDLDILNNKTNVLAIPVLQNADEKQTVDNDTNLKS